VKPFGEKVDESGVRLDERVAFVDRLDGLLSGVDNGLH
jgi:hypothetical protein